MGAEIVRLFIFLAVFAAVFLLASAFFDEMSRRRTQSRAVNKRLEMIGRGVDREEMIGELVKRRPSDLAFLPDFVRTPMLSFQRLTFASGVPLSFQSVVLYLALFTVGVFFAALLIAMVTGVTIGFGTLQIVLLFALAIGLLVPIMILQRMAQSRRRKMEQQFPVALDIFVRALRTGHPVASGIELLTNEMEDPIGSEFGLVSDEVAYGSDLIDALQAMAERWNLEDIRMFVVSLSLQNQTGGNLAEILENLSKVIRDRAQMYMKVRALSSEGRMTAWMLTVLPVFAFVSTFILAPSFYLNVADDPVFITGSIVLLVLYVTGVLILRRMVDLKV
ncbi:type II secretion system F family protein [Erythrobacter sp. JK5]|uniref:type II secretion system F family protein n=1 Tax=Erythrobacter sp. JK5 TaxID=2829500 RepID=UPI001BA5CEB4|nr:type II secretion system F family protein [Erythrobacter sp. JK5]QUL38127.1 type II secretion system F family protein [Erythrobacter sp. JK5]